MTGAAKRIGHEIALTLASGGASIVVHYHGSHAEALSLKKQIEALGGDAMLIRADFSSRKKHILSVLERFVKEVYARVPRVDILVNNAAIFYPTPLGSIREADWDQFLTVNLKTPFFLCEQIGMRMFRAKRGKIINLVDSAVLHPAARYIPYAISKAGLIVATRGLAKALAPYVQVNAVAPGPILPSRGMKAGEKRKVAAKTLLKRFGDPGDIAETVRFLIEGSDFITGAVIPVDGGGSIL